MLFQPTDNMSVLTGFTTGKGMTIYISIYSIRVREREGARGNQARSSAAHICKYNGSYAQSRAELPPTAPLSQALIVILA